MNNNIKALFGIYLSISVAVSGYFYINPGIKHPFSRQGIAYYEKFKIDYLDYSNFKYSVLISIIVGILLYSFSHLFKKTKN
ncbi:MAG: hypothetical protein K2Y30_15555 [Flavobacteriaceae bacterium]|nr:hypothetical protein [Flavobacteriaceae bacterium]